MRDCIPKELLIENYSITLFQNFLLELKGKEINFNLSTKSISFLIEKKEKYETLKRILHKYLYFIIDQNLEKIFCDFYFLKGVHRDIQDSCIEIKNIRQKLSEIKKNYLQVSSKILLKKQKLQNFLKLFKNFKKLETWYKNFDAISVSSTDYTENSKNQINNSLSYSQITKLKNEIQSSPMNNKAIITFLFLQNLQQSEKYLLRNFEDDLSSIFVKQRSQTELENLYEMFTKMKSTDKTNKEQTNKELLKFLSDCFKKNIFSLIKGTLLSFAEIQNDSASSSSILKLSMLKGLHFDEEKMFLAIKQICLNISMISKIFTLYLKYNDSSGNLLSNNTAIFVEILSKKIGKVIDIYAYDISGFSVRKWTYQIISCIYVLAAIIKVSFKVDNIEMLKYKINTFMKYIIFDELRGTIMKTGIFLNADTWKRIKISNINE